MVAGAENPLDDQTEAHGIREAVMRRNASLLLIPNQTAAVSSRYDTDTKNTHLSSGTVAAAASA